MAGCWSVRILCVVLILPVGSWPSWECNRKDPSKWASHFQTSIQAHGLEVGDKKSLNRLYVDLRTGALGLSDSPHVVALVGGGEWGPRLVAKALLGSMYANWVKDTVVLDMEEAVRIYHESGFDEAQAWLKRRVLSAIERCPQKAIVVLDNTQVLSGSDLLLLDTFLLLFDDGLSLMEYDGRRVSGDGSLFLLLVNEENTEEAQHLGAKDRLLKTWAYTGPEFTPAAFVGRIDAAMVVSPAPRLSAVDRAAIQTIWGEASAGPGGGLSGDGVSGSLTAALGEVDPHTLKTLGATAAAVFATGAAACWALGLFGEAPAPSKHANAASGGDGKAGGFNSDGGKGSGGGGDGSGGHNARRAEKKSVRTRGGGVDGSPNSHGRGRSNDGTGRDSDYDSSRGVPATEGIPRAREGVSAAVEADEGEGSTRAGARPSTAAEASFVADGSPSAFDGVSGDKIHVKPRRSRRSHVANTGYRG